MRETAAYRWSRTIQRNPVRWVVGAVLVLLALAAAPRVRAGVAALGGVGPERFKCQHGRIVLRLSG